LFAIAVEAGGAVGDVVEPVVVFCEARELGFFKFGAC
jgi:hypothetical protein